MASSAGIGNGLPATLPENFSDWDRETPPVAVQNDAAAPKATSAWGKTPVSPQPSADHEANLLSSSTASDCAEFNAFFQNQELIKELVHKLRNDSSQGIEAGLSTKNAPIGPSRGKLEIVNRLPQRREVKEETKRERDTVLLRSFPINSDVIREQKPARRKSLAVAAVSAALILLLLIFAISLFSPAKKSLVNRPVQPVPQSANPAPKTDNASLNKAKSSALSEKLQTTVDQPQEKNDAPLIRAKMMNDQLTAPSQISQDIKKQFADTAPPPGIFVSTGGDDLGGGASANVFNGIAQPAVGPAVTSKPVTVSAGVSNGMLIQKTTPVYPVIALATHASGTVQLGAVISKNGTITNLRVLSGPPLLQQSAVEAVRTWRYRPYLLNGQPTEVETTVNVVFLFSK